MVSTGTLGTLERVELRTVWPHEEYDFSAWLVKYSNIDTKTRINRKYINKIISI